MSAIGLVNLAERLLNQGSAQGQDLPATQKAGNTQAGQGAAGAAEDQFTPSSQNGQAQEAGLFSVAQFSFFSAAADLLLGQGNAPQPVAGAGAANGNNGAAPLVPALGAPAVVNIFQPFVNNPGANNLATQAAGNVVNATNPGNAINAAGTPAAATTQTQTNANAGTNGAAGGNGATPAAGSQAVQQQIQTLNSALAALGLTPQEIQQLDQIASVLNDFSPTAFTALAYQLEQIAEAQGTQTAAVNTAVQTGGGNGAGAANGNAAGATNTGANGTAGNGAAANPAGFQVQELIIKFAGAQGTAANGNGTTQAAVSAFNLQVEEVNLTLANGNGQTAQAQVLGANANANTNAAAPQARAAKA